MPCARATFVRGTVREAFTLVELLVVITVLVVLSGLTLSGLAKARQQADRIASLARLHELGARFAAYSADFRDGFPYSDEAARHPLDTPHVVLGVGHFQYELYWPLMFPDFVAASRGDAAPHLAPRARRAVGQGTAQADSLGLILTSSYLYGRSFMADPAVWSPDTQPSRALLRAIRTHEVAFAARKVILWDYATPYLSSPPGGFAWDRADAVPMLFVDGRAADMKPAEASPGARGLTAAQLDVSGGLGGMRIQDTPGGVRGIDY